MKREIIKIDEKKCNGCGLCIPNCPEGAIQIIDGKARLISDLFCDGLGACINHCPEDAIKIEKREANPYDEAKVMENIIPQGENTIRAHLEHLEEHGETKYLNEAIEILRSRNIKIKRRDKEKEIVEESSFCSSSGSCPGSQILDLSKDKNTPSKKIKFNSELQQWPVQLNLLPSQAPFFKNSDLLVCADCVPFAYANFHEELLKDKTIVIGCPKLDDIKEYEKKLTEILKHNEIKSVTVAIMEVPCCHGMYSAVENAIRESGNKVKLIQKIINVQGDIS